MRRVVFVIQDPTDSDISKDLVPFLDGEGLLSDGFLYSVIDGSRLAEFLEHGTYGPDEDAIHALQSKALMRPEESSSESFDGYLRLYPEPAVAVYDGNQFDKEPISDRYRFKDPRNKKSALVATVEITLNPSIEPT